jgi:hypothetical protein
VSPGSPPASPKRKFEFHVETVYLLLHRLYVAFCHVVKGFYFILAVPGNL